MRTHSPAIRVGARCVEALHPTLGAEGVLGLVSVERVGRQTVTALEGKQPTAAHTCINV